MFFLLISRQKSSREYYSPDRTFCNLFISFFLLWQRQDDHTRYNSDKSCQIHSRKSHLHKEYRHHRCCQRLNRCKQTCLGTSDQTNPFHITAKGHYRTKYDHDCNAADTLPVQKDISRHRPWLHKWCQTDSTDQHSPADHGKGSSIKLGSPPLSLVNTGFNGKHIRVLCSFL